MDREILVSVDLHGAPVFVGRLWWRSRKGRESASFEYDPGWLEHPERFALEPALALTPGPFHTAPGRSLFGAVGDSTPDRWGRLLMRRAERRRARQEGRAPRALSEADVLLRVDDEARQGALRFSTETTGPFLAEPGSTRIPPLVELQRLLVGAERVADDEENDDDIRLLLGPGSSLGGARPKASVRDADGRLCIAKFPHSQDEVDVVLWEGIALALAEESGIDVPERRIETVAGKRVLYEDHRGWRLSPAYDLNPVPTDIRPRVLSTSIAAHEPTASLDLALETAGHYRLGLNEANAIAKEVANAVAQWRAVARRLGAARQDIDRMASAFEHADLDAARRL